MKTIIIASILFFTGFHTTFASQSTSVYTTTPVTGVDCTCVQKDTTTGEIKPDISNASCENISTRLYECTIPSPSKTNEIIRSIGKSLFEIFTPYSVKFSLRFIAPWFYN